MRVLIFSTDDHLYPAGGAEQAMGEITKRLPDIEFDLICAKLRKQSPSFEQVGNVAIYRIGFGIPKLDGILLALFGHFKAFSLAHKNEYDLLWSIMASYGAFSAVRVKKQFGIPLLLTLQEGDPTEYILNKVRSVRKQFDEIFSIADGLQPISQFLRSWGKDMGYTGEVDSVIPNGVDIENFTQEFDTDEIAELRKEFGFSEDALVLLTSSRLEIKNGVGDVVDALPLMDDNVCFVICGTGSLEDEIREKVRIHKLEDRVKFMGFVTHELLPKLLQASDVFIRPSLTEGLGNAFLEGMAAHRCVIGTLVGGIPDFLFDGKTGFACKPENPQSIADAVTRIQSLSLEDKEVLLERAYTQVVEIYNWEVIVKQMRERMELLALGE